MGQPSTAVMNAARKQQPEPDKLQALQAKAAVARDLELEIADLQSTLKEKNEALNKLYRDTLPSMLDEVKLDRIGVPPIGNKPGVDYKLYPYYSASIAAKWPMEKKQEAYDLLKRLKAESLIKTEVSAALPKGNLKLAQKLYDQIKKLKVPGAAVELSQTVHSGTLSSWLRELYNGGQSLSETDLSKIGGSVGRIVKAEERRT